MYIAGSIAKTIAIAIPSVWSEMCVARADRSSEALRKGDAVADLDDHINANAMQTMSKSSD